LWWFSKVYITERKFIYVIYNKKMIIVVILFIVICILLFVSIEKNKNNAVKEQMEDSIPELILYYSPSCGHCHDFMNNGWQQLKDKPINIKLVEFNCNEYNCKGIDAYPTIILKKNQKVIPYNGNRSYEDIINFVSQN